MVLSCSDILSKIKENKALSEEEKKHLVNCPSCLKEYDNRFEEKLNNASNILRKKTEKKVSDDFTRNIMVEIGIGVRERIKVINYKYLLITFLSFFISLTAYFVANNSDMFFAENIEKSYNEIDYSVKTYVKKQNKLEILNSNINKDSFLIETENNMLVEINSPELGPIEIFNNSSFYKKDKNSVELSKGKVFFNVSQIDPFKINMGKVILFTNSSSFLIEKESNISIFMFKGNAHILIDKEKIELEEGVKIIINTGYSNYTKVELSSLDYNKLEELRDEKNK